MLVAARGVHVDAVDHALATTSTADRWRCRPVPRLTGWSRQRHVDGDRVPTAWPSRVTAGCSRPPARPAVVRAVGGRWGLAVRMYGYLSPALRSGHVAGGALRQCPSGHACRGARCGSKRRAAQRVLRPFMGFSPYVWWHCSIGLVGAGAAATRIVIPLVEYMLPRPTRLRALSGPRSPIAGAAWRAPRCDQSSLTHAVGVEPPGKVRKLGSVPGAATVTSIAPSRTAPVSQPQSCMCRSRVGEEARPTASARDAVEAQHGAAAGLLPQSACPVAIACSPMLAMAILSAPARDGVTASKGGARCVGRVSHQPPARNSAWRREHTCGALATYVQAPVIAPAPRSRVRCRVLGYDVERVTTRTSGSPARACCSSTRFLQAVSGAITFRAGVVPISPGVPSTGNARGYGIQARTVSRQVPRRRRRSAPGSPHARIAARPRPAATPSADSAWAGARSKGLC